MSSPKFINGQRVKFIERSQGLVYYNTVKSATYDHNWDMWVYTLNESRPGVTYREDWLLPLPAPEFNYYFSTHQLTPRPTGGWERPIAPEDANDRWCCGHDIKERPDD